MPASNEQLIASLRRRGILRSRLIAESIGVAQREDFVPEEFRDMAYEDEALPIPEGQTISQPYTVVFMLELLGVRRGETVIDIGYGSGWQTALLAHMVGPSGRVYAIEIIPSLCEFGESNVAKYPELYRRVLFECGDASRGPMLARHDEQIDRIIVAADVGNVPPTWRRMLRVGGVLVYPSRGVLVREQKLTEKQFTSQKYPGFEFVPFVEASHRLQVTR